MAKKGTLSYDFEMMQVGEEKEYPASKVMTVQSMASMLGFKWDRIYSTCIDRERKVVTVIRRK